MKIVVNYKTKKNTAYLKWIDCTISNLKSYIQGTYHGVNRKYLSFAFAQFEWHFKSRKMTTLEKMSTLAKVLIEHSIFGVQQLKNHFEMSQTAISQ